MVSCANAAFFIAAQAGVSTVARGGVGVGKNAVIEAMIRHLGYVCHVFIPSQHAPEDVGGIPVHDAATGHCRMSPMEWMFDLKLALRWLHIDEVTSANTQMRPPLLSCFNERRVGSLTFHATTVVTAACNPPDLCPNGSELEPALANRMYHHDWVFPANEWRAGLSNGGNFPLPTNVPKVGAFAHFLPKFGGIVARLTRNKPSLMCVERVPEGELAFPSPRSWWNTVRCLAAADSVGMLEDTRSQLVCGTVGTGAGAELLAMLDNLAMIDVPAFLAGTETVKVSEKTIDRLIGLPSAIVQYLGERKVEDGGVDDDMATKACELLVEMAEGDQPDLSIPCLAEIKTLLPTYKMPAKLAARHARIVTAIYGGA